MVEKLLDRLKVLPGKIKEWWDKFSSKQKTTILAVGIGIIVAFAILITVVTRIQYTNLVTCENTNQASQVKDLLVNGDIKYKVSDSGLVFTVNTKQLSEARLLLGANNIMSDDFGIDKVVNGGLSTTEADKQKLYVAYLESALADDLSQYDFVESASVILKIPEDDGTLIARNQQSYATVLLTLSGTCTEDNAYAIARFVKTAIGNDTTENVVIMDTEGNLLFSGGDELSIAGSAGSQTTAKQQAEAIVKNEVKKVLLGTNEYDLIEVASNLVLDFSTTEYAEHLYKPVDGAAQGVLANESGYEAETTGGTAAVPGTDSNGEGGTYVYQDGAGGTSTESEFTKNYLPNEFMTNKSIPPGLIVYDDSSIAISAISYRVIREEDVENQGLLDGITWDEYKAQNETRTKLDVENDFYSIVANATGIPAERITILAFEEPFFVDKESLKVDFSDIFQIALIVLIVILLAYVVIRSMKTDKNKPEEPEELSVESLLQSMPSEPLEDIELETKSETRKMIEKFVDENPEAVANLLRNWLNEDWG